MTSFGMSDPTSIAFCAHVAGVGRDSAIYLEFPIAQGMPSAPIDEQEDEQEFGSDTGWIR
jgi:hypothetical protein